MATNRISIRMDEELRRDLQRHASVVGKPESEIVRTALEEYLTSHAGRQSLYDVLLQTGFIGCVRNAPRDLSTNRRYFKGLGRS